MTLLQPTDVPSMDGINNAITSEIADAVSTTDPSDQFYDSGWLELPGTPDAGFQNVEKQYRIKDGTVQVRLRGALSAALAVSASGNIADMPIGALPAGTRPGSGGFSATACFPIEIGGVTAHVFIYNGGTVNLATVESRGANYNLGGVGTGWSGISPTYIINA